MQVEAKYMQLAKDMLAYERDTTQRWMQHAHASAESLMRQPVLIEDPQTHRFLTPQITMLPVRWCASLCTPHEQLLSWLFWIWAYRSKHPSCLCL